jgi:putative ABC transport system substrate-binding protein
MHRRHFITAIGGGAAWTLVSRAQERRTPVIGFLSTGAPPLGASLEAFHQGLNETGYFEGRNVAIEYRWAENRYDRLSGLAAELVQRGVTAIAANGLGAQAAKAATSSIPIVFYTGEDPVTAGLVTSLSRPGGNLTGVTALGDEVGQKRLELLHELLPTATTLALLINPGNPARAAIQARELEAAAASLRVQIQVLDARSEEECETAFGNLARLHAGGLVLAADPFFTNRSEKLATLATLHRVPAIYQYREFTAAGGLMSYGGNRPDGWRLVGNNIGRILHGERPANLPVQQSTKVELFINLKTANALGLTVPLTLRGRADELIE